MYAGGEGDDVRRIEGSVEVSGTLEVLCEASGSENLRFLVGDVVKVKAALFPCGIRLLGKRVLRREDKGRLVPQEHRR